MPASYKVYSPLAKAEPISRGGSSSGITQCPGGTEECTQISSKPVPPWQNMGQKEVVQGIAERELEGMFLTMKIIESQNSLGWKGPLNVIWTNSFCNEQRHLQQGHVAQKII
ncbi:hypothetical protein BTVI_59937 [Pitangus sulphuratus]|nr:hypothetical protein BTVI_59937 [Pitangus sulphuratus]